MCPPTTAPNLFIGPTQQFYHLLGSFPDFIIIEKKIQLPKYMHVASFWRATIIPGLYSYFCIIYYYYSVQHALEFTAESLQM